MQTWTWLTREQVDGGESPLQLNQQDAEERLRADSSRVWRTLVVHDDLLIALQLQLRHRDRDKWALKVWFTLATEQQADISNELVIS